MHLFGLKDFRPQETLLGGQSFFWHKLSENEFIATHSDALIYLFKEKSAWRAELLSGKIDLCDYFKTGEDYDGKIAKLSKSDEFLRDATESLRGLRLLKQDFADTLFSFILSSNNSIKNIKNCVLKLSKFFGKKVNCSLGAFYLFPSAETLANAEIAQLKKASVGYRAEYLSSSARLYLKNDKFCCTLSGESLIDELKRFSGVGDKVADCVAVFSGLRDDISPVDVWTRRALKDLYKIDFAKYDNYRSWFAEKFGKDASLAGQFIFENYRLRSVAR